MKKIGFTQRLDFIDFYEEIREGLDINFTKLAVEMGYTPVLLSSNHKIKDIKEFELSGVIFTGGNTLSKLLDINTSQYKISFIRDIFEKKLIKDCIKNNIPILGICRGMQVLLDYFGEKLVCVSNHVDVRHKIKIIDASYEKILKLRDVNSYHKYAVKNISEKWNILAISDDDVIEAVSHKKYKILGIMWHPERDVSFFNIQMIKTFFGDKKK